MNVLVINGSPRGKKSNSYQLTTAFLEGMREREAGLETRELEVGKLDLHPCLGCFGCWSKTPGQCCIHDGMAGVIQDLLWADVTIWSFPLYYFGAPGQLKNLIDRQLPMVLPFMEADGGQSGSGSHPARYDMSGKKTVVISTCGFYTAEGNYDGVRSMFDHICGRGNYTAIFCGQGELFRVPELQAQTGAYLADVRQAGREYMEGGVSAGTQASLARLLLPRETFEGLADASWGIDRATGEREPDALVFTRQMALLYQKEQWPGHDLVLEMVYTDIGQRYQVVLGKEGSRVLTGDFLPPTTTVETPITVWRAISVGEIRGDAALMKHLYKVTGDFDLLLRWDHYFSGGTGEAPAAGPAASVPAGKTNMSILLIPWIVLWAAVSIHPFWGGLAALAACALTPLVFFRNRKTVYDVLSGGLVTVLAGAALAGAPVRLVVPLAYLAFGVMWSLSCLRRVPLTAHYSMNDYDGEKALENPLFLKTNRILTLAWGVLYLLTPIWTYFVLDTAVGGWIGAINSVLPLLMGAFTAWFQKWYPARVARG